MQKAAASRRRLDTEPGPPAKQERFGARLTSGQKALFERAAQLTGRTLSEFILGAAQDAAERTIHTHHVLELSECESEAFLVALENPPRLHARLEQALRGATDSVETTW